MWGWARGVSVRNLILSWVSVCLFSLHSSLSLWLTLSRLLLSSLTSQCVIPLLSYGCSFSPYTISTSISVSHYAHDLPIWLLSICVSVRLCMCTLCERILKSALSAYRHSHSCSNTHFNRWMTHTRCTSAVYLWEITEFVLVLLWSFYLPAGVCLQYTHMKCVFVCESTAVICGLYLTTQSFVAAAHSLGSETWIHTWVCTHIGAVVWPAVPRWIHLRLFSLCQSCNGILVDEKSVVKSVIEAQEIAKCDCMASFQPL